MREREHQLCLYRPVDAPNTARVGDTTTPIDNQLE